jgi:hypothetical protein
MGREIKERDQRGWGGSFEIGLRDRRLTYPISQACGQCAKQIG